MRYDYIICILFSRYALINLDRGIVVDLKQISQCV